MNLREVLQGVPEVRFFGTPDLSITGLHYDSRRIQPGNLFVAICGAKTDGNRHIPQALARGAIAVASEASPASSDTSAGGGSPNDCAWVRVGDARKTLSLAAANFYGRPAGCLALIGVTGTNGKTTTTFLLDSVLASAGQATGLFGTIEYRLAGRRLPASNTTPESLDLQQHLAELLRLGGTHAVLEVSSHALALDRVYGCPFRVAVFTNLTRDHLDFHGSLEAYFAEKRKLFMGHGAPPPEWAVLNADDPWSAQLRNCGSPNALTYGLSRAAQVRPSADTQPTSGRFAMETPRGNIESRSPLMGRPNVYNLLAAAATALALGLTPEQVERGLAALENVPGRFERVDAGQPFMVVVDYAHTDDALRNLTATARGLAGAGGRVITLFGCGGDRDRTKRPLMGEAAGAGSDLVVLTSDNPRSEDPVAIINDALPGVEKTGTRYYLEPDRAKAIELAITEARRGDIVLIAGKGHENYQVLGRQTVSFDDRLAARQVLARQGYQR